MEETRREKKKQAASCKTACFFGGPEGDRTLDLTDANRTRSQLRYGPKSCITT